MGKEEQRILSLDSLSSSVRSSGAIPYSGFGSNIHLNKDPTYVLSLSPAKLSRGVLFIHSLLKVLLPRPVPSSLSSPKLS